MLVMLVGLASVDAAVDSGGLRGEVEAASNFPLAPTVMLSSRESDSGDESGAGTDISVGEDQRAAGYGFNQPRFQRAGQKHRRWDPMMLPAAPTNESRRCSILRGILQREHYSGDFIGDDVLEEGTSSRSIRICTTNINKNLRAKLSEEVAAWFISHEMDVMVVSDAGLGSSVMNQVWVDTLERTTRAPGLVLIGAGRVGMLFNAERWGNRICRKDIIYSESRRSMRVKLRLPRRHSLWVIGTYIHHAPERHQEEVVNGLAWIQEQCVLARENGAMIAVGGDFNTYPDSTCDHVGPGNRSHQAENMSARFKAWTDEHALSSSFRLRHPTTVRYTYERAATKSALDDIYVSSEHNHLVSSSSIWLRSIHCSDHVGVPVMTITLDERVEVPRELQGVRPIKVVNTRNKTPEDMLLFGEHTQGLLDRGEISLVEDTIQRTSDASSIMVWLERAIENMYQCLNHSAVTLWGESNQTKRCLARSVSIKRSRRCTAQLRDLLSLCAEPEVTVADLLRGVAAIQWPTWVREPHRLVPGCAHEHQARVLNTVLDRGPPMANLLAVRMWIRNIDRLWRKTMRIRRNWRQTQRRRQAHRQRHQWFSNQQFKSFLQSTLGKGDPPVSIRSALIDDGEDRMKYSEDRAEIQQELTKLLDVWIPPDERTQRPRYLDTEDSADTEDLPQFVREWVLPDMERERANNAASEAGGEERSTWDEYIYDENMQIEIDRGLRKHVAPGYGGISQEMWIAAPPAIRARERRIISLVLSTGLVPSILLRKQMVFLPKAAAVDTTLRVSAGLPPWRPITVQSSLASRLQLVIKRYVDRRVENCKMQHGFQHTRTVQDASLLTGLLVERAHELKESLFLVSKDCLKCYDRVPRWVMDFIYRRLGVPVKPRQLMIDLLGPGTIEVRSAFGWIDTGEREFGLGQGSILSILHIGCYMDLLQTQLEKGEDPVEIKHHQHGGGIDIASTLFVDDQLDISTSYRGLQSRAEVTNIFTGANATGGVFGAAKSFMMYLNTGRDHYPAIRINDGLGIPRPVQVVTPAEGFKHLGVYQGGESQWAASISPTWAKLCADAKRLQTMELSAAEFRYVVNHIWVPRLRYRMILSDAVHLAAKVDVFIRQAARNVLRLPYTTPLRVFYDAMNGLGLINCEQDTSIERFNAALRILNDSELPVHHVLVEQLERYQERAGLTENPLVQPVRPPNHVRTWTASLVKYAAGMDPPLQLSIVWTSPPTTRSKRGNDRCLLSITPLEMRPRLVALNWGSETKLRHVGDLATTWGTKLLREEELVRSHRWTASQRAYVGQLYPIWKEQLVVAGSRDLREAVGCTPINPSVYPFQMRIGVGQWIVVCQLDFTLPEPNLVDYEIGYRLNSASRQTRLGVEIEIRWWYQRPRGSDIWYERTTRRTTWEYEAVCVPITPRYLPCRRQRSAQRVIVWQDTTVGGVRGLNDRSLLHEAMMLSRIRYEAVACGSVAPSVASSCTECGRHRGVSICGTCGRWHHYNCIRLLCPSRYQGEQRSEWERARWFSYASEREPIHVPVNDLPSAGDGSVIHAKSARCQGGWAVRDGGTTVYGQLLVHKDDITSTRCEIHALIAGVALSGDTGNQICDNTSAIRIFQRVRRMLQTNTTFIKYADPHRMEVRSLLNLLTRTGDRSIEWVRSHQELMHTDDHELRRKRAALALADEAAKASHTYRMTGSCMGWLSLESWMVLDPDGRPVLGNTLSHLRSRQLEVQRRQWLALEASKAEEKQVMTADERGMVWRYRWGMTLCRFYWRARFGLLHTSAVKHRLDRRWSSSCRCCEEECRDTQSHRFGQSQPVCCNTTELESQLHVMHAALERDLWLPDQHLFIPILGHQAAKRMELPQRPRWKEDNGRQVAWQPMVNIGHGHWCDAQWISWIGDIRQASIRQYLWRALSTGTYLRRAYPAGRLIPQRLQDAARRSMDNKAGFASMHLVQWTPGWATATFDQGPWINAFSVEQRLAVPSTVQGWWLDDVYFPRGEGWWEDTEVRITTELSRAESTVYWIAVYANTPGFDTVNRLGGQWLVRIPSGKLRMRTDYAVAQQQQQPRRRITSTNSEVIMIGIVAAPQRIPAHVHAAQHIWAPVLHDYYSPSWLLIECSAQTTPVSVHPIFELGFVHDHPASRLLWWTDARRQMELLFPQIYGASTGWRRYPTLSAACEDWARSLSYTSKEAATLLRRYLTDHWDTLRRYWELTCRRTNDAIEDTDDVATRDRVNSSIRSRREAHARRPGARVDNLLARRQLRLTEMSDYWTTQRTVALEARHDPARQ